MPPKKILVVGADGQLGKALRKLYDGDSAVEFAGRAEFDLGSEAAFTSRNWKNYSTIINAAAYTAVDAAETPEGRRAAWAVNVTAVARLARTAVEHGLVLVHVSSDYVFDGTRRGPHRGRTVVTAGRLRPDQSRGRRRRQRGAPALHCADQLGHRRRATILSGPWRPSRNEGVEPSVVNDQIGRLSFTDDIAAGIRHLLASGAPYGTYNLTNNGDPQSWPAIAADVFELTGRPRAAVTGVSTAEYFAGKSAAPRPQNSTLELGKLAAQGFHPPAAAARLRDYLGPDAHTRPKDADVTPPR